MHSFYFQDAIDVGINKAGVSFYEFVPGKRIPIETPLDKGKVVHSIYYYTAKKGARELKRTAPVIGTVLLRQCENYDFT